MVPHLDRDLAVLAGQKVVVPRADREIRAGVAVAAVAAVGSAENPLAVVAELVRQEPRPALRDVQDQTATKSTSAYFSISE
jgi:hypothetical protein